MVLAKKIIHFVFDILEHNPEHFIVINIFGEKIKACSRCLGAYVSGFICYFIFGLMYLYGYSLPFYPVFIASFLLGSVTLVDFATVDVFHIRKGNNRIRLFAGILLGIGAMLYFWLLPASWFFRILTLLFYNMLAILVAYISVRLRKTEETQVSISK
jgi:uncharacterized membrane protein